MSHRIGECSSCGAKYKLPDTFSADQARCKQCDGVVEIGPVVSSEPAPVESKPKKREGPSMKERLLAQRQEDAAKAVPAAKPAKKAAPKPADKPAAKSGVRSSRSSAPARSRKASRRRGADDDDEKKEESGSRKRPARRGRQKKKAPVLPFLLALVAFVFVAGGVWYMFVRPQPEGEQAEPKGDEVAAVDGSGNSENATDGTSEETTGDASSTDNGTPESSTPDEIEPEDEPEKPKAAAAPKDPNSIDLTLIDDFGPIAECSDARFAELKQLAAEMVDPMSGAAGTRAQIKLEAAGKEAFPVVINIMKKLDLTDEDGFRGGDQCQKTLQHICNGMNAGWWYPDTSPDDYLYMNKKAIKLWCSTWVRVKDDEAKWLKLTKQDKKADATTGDAPKEDPGLKEEVADDLDDLDDL